MYKTFADLRAKRAKGEDGFTLIELLVVVVILGVLIAIAIPVYLNYQEGANDAAAESDVRNAISVLEVCNASDGTYPELTGDDATWTGTAAPCDGQTVNLSENTTILYTPINEGVSYRLAGTNADGEPKFFCYNSATGGSVSEITPAPANLAAATC